MKETSEPVLSKKETIVMDLLKTIMGNPKIYGTVVENSHDMIKLATEMADEILTACKEGVQPLDLGETVTKMKSRRFISASAPSSI